MTNYPDACPVCPPGVPDVALPLGGGNPADYQCGTCRTAWSTWFDRHGWPLDRLIAPISREEEAA